MDPLDSKHSGEIELAEIAAGGGTTLADLEEAARRQRRRRRLGVLLGLGFGLLTGLALLAAIELRRTAGLAEHTTDSASEILQTVETVAASGQGQDESLGETIAPTGKTIPGVVYVDSVPGGATVRIAGKVVGQTPLMIQGGYPGRFVDVQVAHPGYRTWKGRVEVIEGGLRADVTLEPLATARPARR